MRISGQPHGLNPQMLAEDRLKNQSTGAGKTDQATGGAASQIAAANIQQERLDQIRQVQQPEDDIRSAKVEALKLAIAEGRYNVSDQQIADAMLRDGTTKLA
jgi:flagellar biosynthesis anti-sigma factor FlgM